MYCSCKVCFLQNDPASPVKAPVRLPGVAGTLFAAAAAAAAAKVCVWEWQKPL